MSQDEVDEALVALQEGIAAEVPITTLSRLYFRYILARHGGNKARAAKTLNVDRRTVQRWEREDKKPPPAPAAKVCTCGASGRPG